MSSGSQYSSLFRNPIALLRATAAMMLILGFMLQSYEKMSEKPNFFLRFAHLFVPLQAESKKLND
jgi:hypothetical protein